MFERREILLCLAATTINAPLFAQQRKPAIVRHDVATPEGQRDLEKYRRAVERMMALPASDPRSWTYQWYIHSIPSDRNKQGELDRLYPTASAARSLASECWSTCQAHFPGANADFFLPWHRAYLMGFEATVRAVLNDPGFALPYWNYTKAGQRALPSAFLPQSGLPDSKLVRSDRTPDVNQGLAIDAGFGPQTPVNAAALLQTGYRPRGPEAGFCRELDRKLHGTIHTLVGNGRGMGSVPWAANDPIFWLHHANIDRLWASWNALGGTNPSDATFLAGRFVFPNGTGGRAIVTLEQLLSLSDAGYHYDALEPGQQIVLPTSGPIERQSVVVGTSDAGVTVPAGGASIPLRATARPPNIVGTSARRSYLVLSGLSSPTQPGVVYDVQVRDRRKVWRNVGFINFFDAVPMAHDMDGATMTMPPDSRFSFDVTELVAGTGRVPAVRVAPVGAPENEVAVTIARIDVVEY